MKKSFKVEHEKEKGVIRISSGGWGIVCVIVKNQIKLKDTIPYEANEEGRCIGFEVGDEIDLEPFYTYIKKFAEENSIEIIE
jgi:hypothetical protein